MAAFSRESFSTSAFSVSAFDFGEEVTVASARPSGGFPAYDGGRTKREVTRDRERFGIPDEERLEAERVIREIALRQAQKLERDEQKRFEELSRELKLRKIEWEGRYLESLNIQRQKLIDDELYERFKRFRDEQDILLLLMMASVV